MSSQVAAVSIYSIAHGGLAAFIGRLADAVFPVQTEHISDLNLGLQIVGQWLVSVAVSVQVLEYLQPEKAPPIGDGVVWVALAGSQPKLRQKMDTAYKRTIEKFLRANGLAPPVPAGPSTGPNPAGPGF